jgi:hypothetical protein
MHGCRFVNALRRHTRLRAQHEISRINREDSVHACET